jgi:hypothetical protein
VTAEQGKPRRVDRRHHKVEQLPPHIFEQMRKRIVEDKQPYEQVEAWLAEQGHPVGHSSIHRWHRRIRQLAPLMDARARFAEVLVSAAAGDPSTVQNAAYQLLMQQTLELLIAADEEEGEPLSADALAKIMSAMARLGGTATALTKSLDERRQKQIAAANQKVDAMAKDGRLPASAVETIKRLYGLQSPEPEESTEKHESQ